MLVQIVAYQPMDLSHFPVRAWGWKAGHAELAGLRRATQAKCIT